MIKTTTTENNNQPSPRQAGRATRRASMRDMNSKLLREREVLNKEIGKLQRSNHAMNVFLSDIAGTVGVSAPKTAVEGINAADLLRERIIRLVELEKRVKEKEEKEHPMLILHLEKP